MWGGEEAEREAFGERKESAAIRERSGDVILFNITITPCTTMNVR